MNSNQKILASPQVLCYIEFKDIGNVTDIVTGKVSGNIVLRQRICLLRFQD